ncbi:alpha/beta fold hydrolase [Pseudalkalibacillus sp. JSM 102089]|uniref:alpha/beta fold hydrolase n=1 Tax=Pseudalkalibacillus sp. JSM 102089 TaxID=3229856 RepID=UPI003524F150
MKKIIIEIDGSHVHGFEWGDRSQPTVILLHGLTNNALGFSEMAEGLKDYFHLISIDLPGHGETPPFNEDKSYSFEFLTEWLHKVCTSLSEVPVWLIGHSWGAALALHYSSHFSKMVKGIVMIDGGYLHSSDDPSLTLEELLEQMSQWVAENHYRKLEEYEQKKKREIGRWSKNLEEMVHRDMEERKNGVALRASGSTVRAIMKSLYQEPCKEIFHMVNVPIYLLRATLPVADETNRMHAANVMRNEVKGECRIDSIPKTGHALHWQKSEEALYMVERWLKEHTNQKGHMQGPE